MESNIKNDPDYLMDTNKSPVVDDVAKCESIAAAVIADGKDPTNFWGVNLIEKIYNSDGMSKNLPGVGNEEYCAYALILLSAGDFTIPDDAKWTKDKLIQTLLSEQKSDGGWNRNVVYPTPQANISQASVTAEVISALAPYYNTNADVKKAIDNAIALLQERQASDGGFGLVNNSSDSGTGVTAPVITALCSLGIDPATDSGFIKGDNNPMDALLSFALNDNSGFGGTNNTSLDPTSTEVGFRGITAYKLFKEGKGSIYNFTTAQSSNADLSNLSLSGVTLNQAFDSSVTYYTASVGNEVSNTDITAAAADSKAQIKVSVNGEDVSGQQANLNVGENNIKVEVTAEDGTVKTYNIVVTRAAESVVNVTGITLDKTSTTVEKGSTDQLTAVVAPENATNKNVTWTSDKPEIAAVDQTGKITAEAEGTATITASTEDGNKTAACSVTVTDNSQTNLVDISTDLPEDASFKLGSDAKVTINAVNNSDEEQPVSLILALFNKDNNAFVTYTAAQQDVESKGSTALTGSIKLPDTGNYELKAFVWDGLDDMEPLSDVKTVPVVSGDTGENDSEVTFADWGLEEAVRDSIGKPEGTLYKSDVDKITELDVTGKNILDLGGIENLTSLETLNLTSNRKLNVDTISKLNELPHLEYLDLSSTPVDDLSVLSGLSHLQSLKLYMNSKYDGFANLDGLKSLTNLKELDLSDNPIGDINGLKDLTNLEKLNLEDTCSTNTTISDISVLSGLKNLQYLNLSRNNVEDVSSLGDLTNLQYLDLDSNPVNNISALSKLTNLQTLLLSKYSGNSQVKYDKINDISALSGLKNLTTLDLSYNSGITDLSTLKGLTNLKSLVLYGITIDDDGQQDLKNALPNCNIAF
ncbi:leucine-rich repeat domain-containing protein [Clostridium sp. JNZ X4-2]